ncbi:hypothetical protein [Phycicoccus sonneratiae]|uniref:DUF4439 domain-containing protein n=1 Tax=Phycicoccus sonneratiae TaxID=2807628 RepID=A0ABS2CKF3_9MICO|nr:hypothetical protein [Phycicoccus sonneraticus]MBM6400368.1 hypothetical protein [Phycicoccus sonneraticus]
MAPVPDLDARRPGRRLLLAGVGAALLTPVAGCGVRLENDAPRVPLVPTREPLPGEAALLALTLDSERLADLADALGTPLGTDLATLHRRQHTVLRTTLLRRGVPAASLGPTPTPSPTRSGSPTPSPSPSTGAATLGATEADAAAGAARFSTAAADLLPSLAALHAQRWAAGALLTGSAPPRPVVSGPPDGLEVGDLAEAVDAAAYLAEVGTARSTGARRERGAATVTALRALRSALRSGEDAPPAGLGRPLPFPVRSAADVDRLLWESLTALRAALGAGLADLVAADPVAGLDAATRWLGGVEVEAHRWGVPLVPFPGLT